jgi:hypothetical protein
MSKCISRPLERHISFIIRKRHVKKIRNTLIVKCRSAVVKSAAFWPNYHHKSG